MISLPINNSRRVTIKMASKKKKTLSIIIPVFNEEKTLEEIVKRVFKANLGVWDKEVIIVDDGSTDSSKQKIQSLKDKFGKIIRPYFHKKNLGKGGAIQTGLKYFTGEAVIVQDSDLEYDPKDIIKLLRKLEEGKAKIIFGSRGISVGKKEQLLYVWGINLSTHLINLLYGSRISDLYTCYKLYDRSCLKSISANSKGFEWDIELVAKLLKKGYSIDEVQISYTPRKFSEGKKIKAWDGIAGLWMIFKHRFF